MRESYNERGGESAMNYIATFKLDNGITGEVKLTATNDGEAFIAVSKMFMSFKIVEWNMEKAE